MQFCRTERETASRRCPACGLPDAPREWCVMDGRGCLMFNNSLRRTLTSRATTQPLRRIPKRDGLCHKAPDSVATHCNGAVSRRSCCNRAAKCRGSGQCLKPTAASPMRSIPTSSNTSAARRVNSPNCLGAFESDAAWLIPSLIEAGSSVILSLTGSGTVPRPQRTRETGQTDAPGGEQG